MTTRYEALIGGLYATQFGHPNHFGKKGEKT